jgi:hypothetical protein
MKALLSIDITSLLVAVKEGESGPALSRLSLQSSRERVAIDTLDPFKEGLAPTFLPVLDGLGISGRETGNGILGRVIDVMCDDTTPFGRESLHH